MILHKGAADMKTGFNRWVVGALALSSAGCAPTLAGDVDATAPALSGEYMIILADEALMISPRAADHVSGFQFPTPRIHLIEALTPILGRPQSGRNEDCPTGAVDYDRFGALTLHFENGRFAGWVMRGRGGDTFRTYPGFRVGDRRSQIEDDVEVQQDGTIGTELSVRGLGVLLDGPGSNARITTLFSGITCFAR